jgi:hypothetical protein
MNSKPSRFYLLIFLIFLISSPFAGIGPLILYLLVISAIQAFVMGLQILFSKPQNEHKGPQAVGNPDDQS